MIDPAIGWFEIVETTNKSVTSIQDLFHNTWLERYPRPQFIAYDNENIGKFKSELNKFVIIMALSQINYKSQHTIHKHYNH
jgi:hypothetical protein